MKSQDKIPFNDKEPRHCYFCMKRFSNSQSLVAHLKGCPAKKQYESERKLKKSWKRKGIKYKYTYICNSCDTSYNDPTKKCLVCGGEITARVLPV